MPAVQAKKCDSMFWFKMAWFRFVGKITLFPSSFCPSLHNPVNVLKKSNCSRYKEVKMSGYLLFDSL